MPIPKTIHYCWFGGKEYPRRMRQCINSWVGKCPDYELMCWDEKNSPLDANNYVAEAYSNQKWAFVSDFVRIYALNRYGGIYLDTDVELVGSFDPFLANRAFMGFESDKKIATCVIGAEKEHPFFRQVEEIYNNKCFVKADKSLDTTTNVQLITERLNALGLCKNGSEQTVEGIEIFPAEFFSVKDPETGKIKVTSNTVAIHHFSGSWLTASQKRHMRIAQLLGPKMTEKIKTLMGKKHE